LFCLLPVIRPSHKTKGSGREPDERGKKKEKERGRREMGTVRRHIHPPFQPPPTERKKKKKERAYFAVFLLNRLRHSEERGEGENGKKKGKRKALLPLKGKNPREPKGREGRVFGLLSTISFSLALGGERGKGRRGREERERSVGEFFCPLSAKGEEGKKAGGKKKPAVKRKGRRGRGGEPLISLLFPQEGEKKGWEEGI